MSEISLSIIGTAGRRDDKNRLSKKTFEEMYVVADELINSSKRNDYEITHLVSGGAAWADHLAVRLFLNKKVKNLKLYIPCYFDNFFFDKIPLRELLPPANSDRYKPGDTLNYYHSLFSKKIGINSLDEIKEAKAKGAELIFCEGGFLGRNSMVAQSDIILAMTFGHKNMVKEGGTADTIRKYLKRVEREGFFNKSFHYNLSDKKIYNNVISPVK